jgi:hypothetical protein
MDSDIFGKNNCNAKHDASWPSTPSRASQGMFDLQETDTSEPREYRNYPFLSAVQSLVAKRDSIKIPARFVCRFRTASYPRAIMRVAIRRFFQDEVPT